MQPKRRRKKRRDPEGHIFEEQFLGRRITSKRTSRRTERVSLEDGFQEVILSYRRRNKQPLPVTRWATQLFRKIEARLPEDKKKSLRLYDALGSSLDTQHQIDGFFKLDNRAAAFDLTTLRILSVKPPTHSLLIFKINLDHPPYVEEIAEKLAEQLLHGTLMVQ